MEKKDQKSEAMAEAIAAEMNAEKKTGDDVSRRSIHLLTGQAPEKIYPHKIDLKGDIFTVRDFIQVRQRVGGSGVQTIDKSRAVIIVDKEGLSIELQLDPENKFGAAVKGSLSLSPELEAFKINGTETFTKDQFLKLVKFNRLFFADATRHQQLVNAFMKLESSVSYNSKDEADDRGNKNRAYVKNVET